MNRQFFVLCLIPYQAFKFTTLGETEGIEKQDLQKSVEYLDKGIAIALKNWVKNFTNL